MEFAQQASENLPETRLQPPSPLPSNAGVISPEPLKACLMNLQGYYLSVRAACVCLRVHVCSCVCKTSLFRQIAAFLMKPQVKCFKWTLSSMAVRGGGGGRRAPHDNELREMNHCVQNGHAHFVDTDDV